MHQSHVITMEPGNSPTIDRLEVHQDNSVTISATKDILEAGDPSIEQEIDGHITQPHEDAESSDSRPTSILGSLGRTIRSIVGGQLASDGSSEPDGSKCESTRLEQVSDDEQLPTPGSLPADQPTESDETMIARQTPTIDAPDHDDDGGVVEASLLINDYESNSTTGPEVSPPVETETQFADLQETTSSGLDVSHHSGNDDGDPETISEGFREALNSPSSDDQFAMTGREAIPGTMTHGSDDSESEIIEPIAGTMTHGVDHLPLESERSLEDVTAVVETVDLENPPSLAHSMPVRNGNEPDQSQFETALRHGMAIEQDLSNQHLTSAFSEGIPVAEERPAVHEQMSTSMTPIENNGSHTRTLDLNQTQDSHRPDHEDGLRQHRDSLQHRGDDQDIVRDEDSWSGADSQSASYSHNESIEVDSTANTSIESVLPASTDALAAKDGINHDDAADHSYDTKEATPNFERTSRDSDVDGTCPSSTAITLGGLVSDESQATAKGEASLEAAGQGHNADTLASLRAGDVEMSQDVSTENVEGELRPHDGIMQRDDFDHEGPQFPTVEGDSRALQQTNDDNQLPDVSNDLDDPQYRDHYGQSFRDDGDMVDNCNDGEEADSKVLLGDNRSLSSKETSQLGYNHEGSGFGSGHSNPETESQSFMTPLASADFHTPMQFQEWHVDQGYNVGHMDNMDSHYELDYHQATTVHGQDDLFDDEDHSDDGDTESDAASALGTNHEDDSQEGSSATPIREQPSETTPPGDDSEPITAIPADAGAKERYAPSVSSNADERDTNAAFHEQPSVSEAATNEPSEGFPSVAPDEGDADMKNDHDTSPRTPTVAPEMTHHSIRPDLTPTASKGLASSRHNPARPRTPEQQIGQANLRTEDMEFETFAPVDVTNVPWHSRRDSTPRSLRSQSTLSSSPSSPIHSSLPVDNHEPVIRDSWPTPTHDRLLLSGIGRPRNDSQISGSGDYDSLRYDSKVVAAQWQQRETADHHRQSQTARATPHRNSIASSSPGGLFQKMRSIFEPAGDASTNRSLPSSGWSSPVWTRVANGAANSSSRSTSGFSPSPARTSGGIVTRDGDGYDSASERRGGGIFTEAAADDEADERSSLLNNSYEESMEVN